MDNLNKEIDLIRKAFQNTDLEEAYLPDMLGFVRRTYGMAAVEKWSWSDVDKALKAFRERHPQP